MSEERLRRRQREHLRDVYGVRVHVADYDPETCAHNRCEKCVGTGIDKSRRTCMHYVVCGCVRCRQQHPRAVAGVA